MITASINFFENNVTADLTRKEFELASDLRKTGILIPINNMSLNNTLTLQVHLRTEKRHKKSAKRKIQNS